MKKILIVFGTRPEAIKMAPVVKELSKHDTLFETLICVTGQHREMLDQVLELFDLVPDYDLNLMKPGQDLSDITCKVITGLKSILKNEKPDLVFIHGDTTTSISTALAAYYQRIPVAHVEAGLRTNNIYSPWPEEINRQLSARIASINYAPTIKSKENLLCENIDSSKIIITGNTVIDALKYILHKIQDNHNMITHVENKLIARSLCPDKLTQWKNKSRRMILITGHRRENFGAGFENICRAIKNLAQNYPHIDWVYPMHLNPNVRKPINKIFENHSLNNVYFIEPLEYLPFVYLMNLSFFVITDSGGIQEEAPGLSKPVLVMRNTTERPEGIKAGTVKLVGTDFNLITSTASELIENETYYSMMAKSKNPYGTGKAAKEIVKHLMNHFELDKANSTPL